MQNQERIESCYQETFPKSMFIILFFPLSKVINVQVEHAKKAGTVCLFYSIVLTKGIFKWDFILGEILILKTWFQNKERNAISQQQATHGAERKSKTKVTGS